MNNTYKEGDEWVCDKHDPKDWWCIKEDGVEFHCKKYEWPEPSKPLGNTNQKPMYLIPKNETPKS